MPSERSCRTDRERHALCLEIGRVRRRLDHRAMRLVDRVPIPGLTVGSFRRHPIRWLLSAGAVGVAVGRWTAGRGAFGAKFGERWESIRQAVVRLLNPDEPDDESADTPTNVASETEDG